MHIDMGIFIKKGIKVLSGRDEGTRARNKLGLDVIDDNEDIIHVNIPNDVWSVNSSFFLSCFGPSIRKLGADGFKKKYVFECDPVILNNVEDGISYALKTSNVLDYHPGR